MSSTKTDGYRQMMEPSALEIAKPYLEDEAINLEKLIVNTPELSSMHCLMIGAFGLPHLALISNRMRGYFAIDPLLDPSHHIGSPAQILAHSWEELEAEDLPSGNLLWFFHFNVFSYSRDPTAPLQRLTRPGDVIAISRWASTTQAAYTREKYLSHVYGSAKDEHVVDPDVQATNQISRLLTNDKEITLANAVADLAVISVTALLT